MFVRRVLWVVGLLAASVLIGSSSQPMNLVPVAAGLGIGFTLALFRIRWLAEHDRPYNQSELRDIRRKQWRSPEVRNGALIGVVIATVISSAGAALGLRTPEVLSVLLAFLSGGMLAVLAGPDRDREVRL
jgi:hypothetical protein